ncbi:MAG: glutamyl-tRNA amidotransferase [Candidatus Moranbacteria bacterium RIFCSPHIGHO2_02_FULL_40_12b]|nr:MAG: glutamyl-tRNA amidotransferase [Candidatus Moranbacteria bacterium RIFCSPHIGHO2_02_FULL_40_12b]OGI24049.1 MAG: glutamyl-tRNA amidotransferase [Candidatus Moranbacteria bacterium RIFCSPHIGHO2_12_FULL_40_10]
MDLKQKISADLKEAMKSGDVLRRECLRMLDAAIKNAEIEKRKKESGLSDDEIIEVAKRLIKQRKESSEQYEKGNRPELAAKEKKEAEILSGYMPEQLSGDKVREIVKQVITETGASSKADTGRVMGQAMVKLKGQADGNVVKKIVEEELK